MFSGSLNSLEARSTSPDVGWDRKPRDGQPYRKKLALILHEWYYFVTLIY